MYIYTYMNILPISCSFYTWTLVCVPSRTSISTTYMYRVHLTVIAGREMDIKVYERLTDAEWFTAHHKHSYCMTGRADRRLFFFNLEINTN
jgi:hypothetical protein